MPPAPFVQTRPPLFLLPLMLLILGMWMAGPIAQPGNYHHFADTRGLDVWSNLGFLLVGMYGLRLLARARHSPGYALFFTALILTSFGSAVYHLAPDNARLVWDRLPIALACAGLLGAALDEAYGKVCRSGPVLLGLSAFAAASVYWWSWSGDLRPYLLIQAAPLLLIPALQWQSRAPARQRRAFGYAIALYVLAKLCELADAAILHALVLVSGHTLKHLLATAAAFVLARSYADMTKA